MSDKSSGLLGAFVGIGQVMGPIYAAVFSKVYGFQLTCDLAAIMSLGVGVLYFVAADGYEAFKNSRLF